MSDKQQPLRQLGCPDCEKVSSGDCGKHGTFIVTGSVPWTQASGGYVPSELDTVKAKLAAFEARYTALVAALRGLPRWYWASGLNAGPHWFQENRTGEMVKRADVEALLPRQNT